MTTIKAHSAEKLRPRLERIKQCLTSPKPKVTNIRDYNRSQPIRIKQLLVEDEERKKPKSSAKKKTLPQRLGPITKTSTQKQGDGLCTYDKCNSHSSHVRRNLDFNNVPDSTVSNETDNGDQLLNPTLTNSQQSFKEIPKPKIRISLLGRPNSIKDKHFQGHLRRATNHSKLDVLKENVPLVKKSAVPICSAKSINKQLGQNIAGHNKKYATESESKISSSNWKVVKNASLNIANKNSENCFKIPSTKLLERDTCCPDERHLKCLESEMVKENECIQRLCNNLESTETVVPENGLNVVKHPSSEPRCINRNEFMHLKCELENLISATEQNLTKLKSTLTYVTELLSIPQKSISQADIYKERETNVKITLDKEIQVEICELKQPMEENSKLHDLQTMDMNNKENVAVRRTDSSPDNTDESFKNLENQLGIKHTESVKKLPSLQHTPVIKKYRQKRSLKEYMSLKSTMSFLQTPDGKLLYKKSNIDQSTVENKSYISNKVLTDLQILYSDSPENT